MSNPSGSPTAIRQAVVTIIEAPDERLLMIERAKEDSFPGYWNFVTGEVDPHDSGLAAAAKREALEEVGVEVQVIGKLWECCTRQAPFLLHWYFARPTKPVSELHYAMEAGEVDDLRWLTLAEARALPLTFDDTRLFLDRVFPAARAALLSREAAAR